MTAEQWRQSLWTESGVQCCLKFAAAAVVRYTLAHTAAVDADVAELADAIDLGSITARCGGSSPLVGTT